MTTTIHYHSDNRAFERSVLTQIQELSVQKTTLGETIQLIGKKPMIIVLDTTSGDLPLLSLIEKAIHASKPCYVAAIVDQPLDIEERHTDFIDQLHLKNIEQLPVLIEQLQRRVRYEHQIYEDFETIQEAIPFLMDTTDAPTAEYQYSSAKQLKETLGRRQPLRHEDFVPILLRVTQTSKNGDMPMGSPIVTEWDTSRPPINAVIDAVAAVEDSPPEDLPALYDVIDPDALNALFNDTETTDRSGGSVSFQYRDNHIIVYSNGKVFVYPADQSGQ